jgi:hypothetical protein
VSVWQTHPMRRKPLPALFAIPAIRVKPSKHE